MGHVSLKRVAGEAGRFERTNLVRKEAYTFLPMGLQVYRNPLHHLVEALIDTCSV